MPAAPTTVVSAIAAWIVATRARGVPAAARHAARRVLLDQVGVSHSGHKFDVPHVATESLLIRSEPDATVWHGRQRAHVAYAALANRSAGDVLELTAGPECVPAAVAVAEHSGATVGELLGAIAVGAEVEEYCRQWLLDGLEGHGLHPPAFVSAVSAAAAAGFLLRAEERPLAGALAGALALTPHSPYAAFSSGASGKVLYGAWGQMLGVWSALWSSWGLVGPASVAEGARGLGRALLDAPAEPLTPPPFDPAGWAITRVTFKPYSCNRACHAALTALEQLGPLEAESVAAIDVLTYPFAVELDRRAAGTGLIATQLSTRRMVALAVAHGIPPAGRLYSAAELSDEAVAVLASRVTVSVDPALDRGGPRVRRARVRVTLSGGTRLEAESEARWGPAQPATDIELRRRFAQLATGTSAFDPWVATEDQRVAAMVSTAARWPPPSGEADG